MTAADPAAPPPASGPFRLNPQEIALIVVTIVWGSTFLVVQHAMTLSGPFWFVALRFSLAGLLLAAVSWRSMLGLTRHELFAGCAIGAAIAVGYSLQTVGLQTIPSSKSAFITALYVPIVPLLQWAILGRPPSLMNWVGVSLAFFGLTLLAGPEAGSLSLGHGETMTLIGAAAISLEIILISRYAPTVDARRVTGVQLLAAAVFSGFGGLATGEPPPDFSWTLIGVAAAMAVASAVIQLTMNWAQKSVSPTRATLIYAGEPVWAGIFGRIAGERLPGLAILGAAFVVAGVIVGEWRLKRRKLS
ncbi:DMT family transporter [Neomegalonema sp.]|uniref:DMT family transporter n=1 Tax=Neomegalonema sp. TaxID=2039713 RepID=UPI002637F79B|nr:DMT family transporter [Neomegalonema sp.]MDD2867359.1 DMT family transporter [Neomegalonema sp.]